MIADRLIERNFGSIHLRLRRLDQRRIRDHRQVRIADGQHHQVARILRRQICGLEIVPLRQIILQRRQIEQRPAQRTANVGVPVRSDDRGEARNAQTFRLQIRLLHGGLDRRARRWQQRLQLLQLCAPRRLRVLRCQNQPQVQPQSAMDRIVEGERQNAGRELPVAHAALVRRVVDRWLRNQKRPCRHRHRATTWTLRDRGSGQRRHNGQHRGCSLQAQESQIGCYCLRHEDQPHQGTGKGETQVSHSGYVLWMHHAEQKIHKNPAIRVVEAPGLRLADSEQK